MKILENIPFSKMTTLRVGGPARYFVEVTSTRELEEALFFAKENDLPVFVMGAGSNLVVSDEGFPGLVIKVLIMGREILANDIDEVILKIGAGEVLDDLIGWTVQNGWWGMENLSFVPGLVGALVIQNAGCYGQDASQVVDFVTVFDRKSGDIKKLKNVDCKFRYRRSIFNNEEKGRYVILDVELRLLKNGDPNTSYTDVRKYFAKQGIKRPSLKQLREVVIEIRSRKGQDTEKVWSVGSFFKNFLLTRDEFEELVLRVEKNYGKDLADELVEIGKRFTVDGEISEDGILGKVKIPAGFVLDIILGLKGLSVGGAKLSEVQVINLVNTGDATAEDVIALYEKVKSIVWDKLGLKIEAEPEFVGF